MPRAVSVGRPIADPDRAAGPRFALRFEDGSGRLALAKPLRFAFGVIEHLVLDLGPLRFPLDLSAGAARFRTRRTHVCSARIRLDLASMLADRVEEPLNVTALAPLDDGMSFALRDVFGTIAVDALARFEGRRLRVVPTGARAVQEGPAPALVRVMVAARALGFDLEEDRGALVFERPLSAALTRALVPHGWRVPDDRSVRLQADVQSSRFVALRSLAEGERSPSPGPAWERARALSPVMSLLTMGEADAATSAFASLIERNPGLDGSDLGFGAPREDGPRARCVNLRNALRAGDVSGAARAADVFERVEPCDAVAVEGLCAAADLAMATRPKLAASLLERACARQPSEARHALRLIGAATRLAESSELSRFIDSGLATREPGPDRGSFAREAAALCDLSGHSELADRLWRLAAESLPNDARVLEGLARALGRADDARGALDAYDRAASAYARDSDRSGETNALREAARHATALEDHAAAEARLTRAARSVDDARVWAALIASRRALGREETALRAEDHLLESVQREAYPDDAVVAALEAGARQALRADNAARARAWDAALLRARPDHFAHHDIEVAIEELELDALVGDPDHLLDLDPEGCLHTLTRADNPGALVVDALSGAQDLDAALRALALVLHGDLASAIADVVAERASEVGSGAALLAIAHHASDDEQRGALLEAAIERLRDADERIPAARALAQLGVLRRDMTMLRAALTSAEREGALDVAREIVEMALDVVGRGPARAALEAVLTRLASQ